VTDRDKVIKQVEWGMKKKCKACAGSGLSRGDHEMACGFCLGTGLDEVVQDRMSEINLPITVTALGEHNKPKDRRG